MKTQWPWLGRSLARAKPLFNHGDTRITGLKLVKAVAGLEKWFWCASPVCKHDTGEHGVHKVQPPWGTEFLWCACQRYLSCTPSFQPKRKLQVGRVDTGGFCQCNICVVCHVSLPPSQLEQTDVCCIHDGNRQVLRQVSWDAVAIIRVEVVAAPPAGEAGTRGAYWK
jgi:hypothetical protein